ncbi:MAG TPA: ComF family protein [Roseiflexaceae bacterium]|nr:ComF family protein [Roseiflexaceae bacterium]
MGALIERLLGLLFPDRCAACRRAGDLFCAGCRALLVPYGDEARATPAGLVAVRIAFTFEGPLREAIHALKYARRRRMAGPLGALMAAHLRSAPLPAQTLLPVPLHPARQAERGFNQAAELAREVAHTAGLAVLERGLVRERSTVQQARLSAAERQANIRGAFVWRAPEKPPRSVLLVDDVLTTGATLSACAAALKEAGTQEVYGLALARSKK